MGKGLLGLMYVDARIRNSYQSWRDQGSVGTNFKEMGTNFKEMTVK